MIICIIKDAEKNPYLFDYNQISLLLKRSVCFEWVGYITRDHQTKSDFLLGVRYLKNIWSNNFFIL